MRPISTVTGALVALLLLSGLARAEGEAPAAQAAIRSVIESQLAAFQRDDGDEAFSYASPGIQRMFRTPENFMDMVRSGYAPVYRPQEFEFRTLHNRGGRLVQEILFVGPDGEPVTALYTMEQQEDGTWRISGVVFVTANDRIT